MYIIAFNGPPRSGKDTFAEMVGKVVESTREVPGPILLTSLSNPLRHIAYGMVGRAYHGNAANYESFKEEYFERLDRTGRQLMIDASERFLKPTYGETVMADLLIQSIRHLPNNALVLVRDSGFQCEVDPLIREVGPENLCVTHVVRDGCSFENDSREWVYHPTGFQGKIYNNSNLDALRIKAVKFVTHLRNEHGWAI